MKNRKRVLTALLLVAVLCISVGFAEVTDLLDIVGVANVLEPNVSAALDAFVYFDSAVPNNNNDTAEIDATKDRVNVTIQSLAKENDNANVVFTIVNTGDRDVRVEPRVALSAGGISNTEYFEVTSDWNGQAKDLVHKGSVTYELTVKLKKTPAELETCNFNIELLVTAIKDGAGSTTE